MGATLRDANFTNANIQGTFLSSTTRGGFSKEQLYSTRSYQEKRLTGVRLSGNNLRDWNFQGQDLANATLSQSLVRGADLRGANLRNASFRDVSDATAALFDSSTTYNQWTLFPPTFDPRAYNLKFVPSPAGDYDTDDLLTIDDVNGLMTKIRTRLYTLTWIPDRAFDLNADTRIDAADLAQWVHDLRGTFFGDATLDGVFDSTDLVQVFAAGKYETGRLAQWHEGDWDADGAFNTADLVAAFRDGGYDRPAALPIREVPEPSTLAIVTIAALLGVPAARINRRVCRGLAVG